MANRLKNKVAIITGGGSGIGKAIALTFASEGASVIVASRTLSRLEATTAEIKANGGRSTAIQTDITDEKQVQQMVSQTINEYKKIDILVNCSTADIGTPLKVVDMTLDKWNKTLAVTLTGTMLCSREVIKTMIPRRAGNIINIGSLAGISGAAKRSDYGVSKWGVVGLTETLAIEVGEYNIRVNCLSPAATNSQTFEDSLRTLAEQIGNTYEEFFEKVISAYSLRRIADKQEVANTALFLASDDSSAITGQNLVVSCGFHLIHPRDIH
jgi:NAD(P)-dependent dehydrogenase (short-subunit alcohol dehydrogenase family)